ncbi:MAG: type II secretion system protein [Candidatus Hydrogenedentota bacterium]
MFFRGVVIMRLKSKKGMTLVELLVSIVVAAIIFIALGRLFAQYVKIFRNANKNLDILIEMRESLDRLGKDLRAAIPILDPINSGTAHPEFRATGSKVRFNCVRASSGMASTVASDIVEIAYTYQQYTPPNYDDFQHWCLQRKIDPSNSESITAATEKETQLDPLCDITGPDLADIQGINITNFTIECGSNLAGLSSANWEAGGDGTPDATGSKSVLPLIRVKLTGTNDAGTATEKMAMLIRPYCWKVKRFY